MPAQQHFGERPSQHHQPCCCLLVTLLQLAKTLADEGCKVSDSAPFKGAAVLSALALLLDSARMSGLQSQLHTLQVPGDSPVGLSTGRELTQQVGGSDLISQLPAILAEAEQEVFLLQAAAAKLPEADHSTKTVFEFNSSRFNDVPTLLLYVPVVLFFTPDVPNGYAVLQSPLLEFAADLLDLTVNMHNLLSNTWTGSLSGLEAWLLPAGRLAVATLQCLSTCLDKLPARPATDMASIRRHDFAIHSSGKSVTKLSSCATIAWRCMAAAELVTERTQTQSKRMQSPDSSGQCDMASLRKAAAAHLATDPCVLETSCSRMHCCQQPG